MIVEIGHFALILACGVALIQMVLPLWGARRGVVSLMAIAAPAACLQFLLVLAAFLALVQAFVTSDFSVSVVAENSHSLKPLLYKITGVWGNHEGSMVLWVLILTLFGALVALFGTNLPAGLKARTLSVQAMIACGFLVFIIATSNPFTRVVPPPADGNDLNPLLQDPGLAFHPPFLYLGYVGFSIVFSFAVAALIEGRVDPAWARWVRPWTLVAWCALTFGITMGSWWAYYELGWGGFWFWDPVENASLMPWLAGTALLHSAIVVEKRDSLKSWTILLAIIAFSLSLIGTFLVRSGVLTSVHAFAVDPARGVFILLLLAVTVGGSLALFALRAPVLRDGGIFAPVSREGALILNNLLLAVSAGVVLFGTLFPLITAAFGYSVSVGAPFFNLVIGILMAPLLCVIPIGPLLAWKRADLLGALQRLWAAGLGALTVFAILLALNHGGKTLAVLGLAAAAWLIVGAVAELTDRLKLFAVPLATSWNRAINLPRATYGMTLAHAGVGIVLAGIIASTIWREERILRMNPGDIVTIAGYELRFAAISPVQGPNYLADQAEFVVMRDGEELAWLRPEQRFYPVQRQQTTEAAIRTTGLGDMYVVLGEDESSAGRTVRIYHNPLAPWLWGGGVLMVIGGLLSLSDRRYRIGVPARRASRTPPPAAALGPAE
ncbi:MAG: heme lyase CcmF/NrfE family subunit [Dongiaceae bacterium]